MSVESNVFAFVALASALGLAAGIFWPYLNARLTTTDPDFKWQWGKVVGRVIGGVVGFFTSAAALATIQELANLVNDYEWVGYLLSFGIMFAYAYAGREGQKTGGVALDKLRTWRNK